MLTYKEVERPCAFWAHKYKSNKFEFNELFNVAYLTAIKQKTVLTLQKSIRGALIRFMQKSQRFTSQCKPLENDNLNSGEENNLALCSEENNLKSLINSEELVAIIEEANIQQSQEFLDILNFIFVEDLTQTEIAQKFNVTPQAISYRYNSIINSLKTVSKRRMLCQK